MPPPVVRSPPYLRSTASADTVADPPDQTNASDMPRENRACPLPTISQMQSTPKINPNNNAANISKFTTGSKTTTVQETIAKKKPETLTEPEQANSQLTAALAEMKKQMEVMKRQLSDTQSQLTESRRKCQQLESNSQTVSDQILNNLNVQNIAAIDFQNTTTTGSRNSQAYNTPLCSTVHAHAQQPIAA